MVRRIITRSKLDDNRTMISQVAAPQQDDYVSRILKLIPGDVVAPFVAADAGF